MLLGTVAVVMIVVTVVVAVGGIDAAVVVGCDTVGSHSS